MLLDLLDTGIDVGFEEDTEPLVQQLSISDDEEEDWIPTHTINGIEVRQTPGFPPKYLSRTGERVRFGKGARPVLIGDTHKVPQKDGTFVDKPADDGVPLPDFYYSEPDLGGHYEPQVEEEDTSQAPKGSVRLTTEEAYAIFRAYAYPEIGSSIGYECTVHGHDATLSEPLPDGRATVIVNVRGKGRYRIIIPDAVTFRLAE